MVKRGHAGHSALQRGRQQRRAKWIREAALDGCPGRVEPQLCWQGRAGMRRNDQDRRATSGKLAERQILHVSTLRFASTRVECASSCVGMAGRDAISTTVIEQNARRLSL